MFNCAICSSSFKTLKGLRTHHGIKHKTHTSNVYQCSRCKASFRDNFNLQKHQKGSSCHINEDKITQSTTQIINNHHHNTTHVTNVYNNNNNSNNINIYSHLVPMTNENIARKSTQFFMRCADHQIDFPDWNAFAHQWINNEFQNTVLVKDRARGTCVWIDGDADENNTIQDIKCQQYMKKVQNVIKTNDDVQNASQAYIQSNQQQMALMNFEHESKQMDYKYNNLAHTVQFMDNPSNVGAYVAKLSDHKNNVSLVDKYQLKWCKNEFTRQFYFDTCSYIAVTPFSMGSHITTILRSKDANVSYDAQTETIQVENDEQQQVTLSILEMVQLLHLTLNFVMTYSRQMCEYAMKNTKRVHALLQQQDESASLELAKEHLNEWQSWLDTPFYTASTQSYTKQVVHGLAFALTNTIA
jgi:hypothetical protein